MVVGPDGSGVFLDSPRQPTRRQGQRSMLTRFSRPPVSLLTLKRRNPLRHSPYSAQGRGPALHQHFS